MRIITFISYFYVTNAAKAHSNKRSSSTRVDGETAVVVTVTDLTAIGVRFDVIEVE